MHLTTADGTRYTVQRFSQIQGTATAFLVMEGIVYPLSHRWDNCTLVLGDRTFNGVTVAVQEVSIYDPLQDKLQPDTTYTVALLFPKRDSLTPDDTQEAAAVRKPPR